jgi:hypothetical protein
VTRIVRGTTLPPKDVGTTLALLVGPIEGDATEEELELAWEAYGEELMGNIGAGRSAPGFRPWAYWRFELGQEPPDDEAIRCAELGLIREDEIAAIAERANEARARIGTAAEHISGDGSYRPDVEAVQLHEGVKRALGRAAG